MEAQTHNDHITDLWACVERSRRIHPHGGHSESCAQGRARQPPRHPTYVHEGVHCKHACVSCVHERVRARQHAALLHSPRACGVDGEDVHAALVCWCLQSAFPRVFVCVSVNGDVCVRKPDGGG